MAFLRRRLKHVPRPLNLPSRTAEFARVGTIQDSIRALYAGLSGPVVKAFAAPFVPPDRVGGDPLSHAQLTATAMARHLGLEGAHLAVSFGRLGEETHAGEVELGPGPLYFITLSSRYREDPRDIPAVLAHEVMHVFLHRKGIRFAETDRNEILTDTATIYLGFGGLTRDACRVETVYEPGGLRQMARKLGYLSEEEIGYVLAKRALAFAGDAENYPPDHPLDDRFGSRAGYRRALRDYERAPLAGRDREAALRYELDRRRHLSSSPGDYEFEGAEPVKVVFPCPACHHRARVPAGRSALVRCGVCRTGFRCVT
jgi:hypothetical protein